MIRVRTGQAPAELLANQQKWTAFWQSHRPKQWAKPGAKKLLLAHVRLKSHGKCAFCESALDISDFAQIEHYHAKTVYPHLVFDWANLFLACAYCNTQKRNADHAGVILKPDVDDGEQHFWFNPLTGELEASSPRAAETIRICELNRVGLCKERLRQYRLIALLLHEFQKTGTLGKKSRQAAFKDLLSPCAEFKLVIRAALPTKFAERDRQKYHAAR